MDIYHGLIKVDHFKRGADAYFLTHYHGDHMVGLRKRWGGKPIHCTETTAALLRVGKEVAETSLAPMALDETVTVRLSDRTVRVTPLEANHCPGACMFLFENDEGRILVTGDFRLDDAMRTRLPALAGVDRLYVDATYRDPAYVFPPQDQVIEDIKEFVHKVGPPTVVVVETYTIGKNRLLRSLYEEFGEPFYLEPHRFQLYQAIGDGDMVTGDPLATRFLACGDRALRDEVDRVRPSWRRNAAIISPKGWSATGSFHRGKVGFPYSEHCSFAELHEFLRAVSPRSIVVTEGGRETGEKLPL